MTITRIVFVLVLAFVAIEADKIKVTEQVYFDITIGGEKTGRILIGLFGDVTPRTVKNFVTIATTGIDGKSYAGTKFHRVIKKFMLQGGDIHKQDGSGSTSIYGKYFDDENFKLNHSGPGFLSMANAGRNTNGCQFFITTITTPWLDGKHTVFGKVIEGQDVVHKIEQVATDSEDRPKYPVLITASGTVPTPMAFYIDESPK